MVCCDRFFILLSHNPAPRITFQNRTISQKALSLLPYERSVGFASLRNSGRSTSGIHARPLSNVRCCRPKKFGRLPEGLLPIRTNPSKTALSLAPHHVLASLVKGEVLSPEKIRATTGGIAPYPHQPSKDLTIPRKSPSPLPFNERSVISHPHYPSRFSYCNRLYALICFHIRTIPPTFRRVRVCCQE